MKEENTFDCYSEINWDKRQKREKIHRETEEALKALIQDIEALNRKDTEPIKKSTEHDDDVQTA
jgi:hypothetical protein